MLKISKRVNVLAAIVAAAKLEAQANDLGKYVAHGVVGDEVIVRFTEGILTKPLRL